MTQHDFSTIDRAALSTTTGGAYQDGGKHLQNQHSKNNGLGPDLCVKGGALGAAGGAIAGAGGGPIGAGLGALGGGLVGCLGPYVVR